jgi:SAM-dependent methyltransferase
MDPDPEDTRRAWAERSGEFSPAYYAQICPNQISETLVSVCREYAADDTAILEVGCGSGRHLAALHDAGFDDLAGLDVNSDAVEVMREHYPRTAAAVEFHAGALEELVPEFADGAFDVVYSVETLQHVHPDSAWVFEELVRVTDDLLITAENEGNAPDRGREHGEVSHVDDGVPLYHRDWKRVFHDLGMAQLLREPGPRDVIRVFRTVG